MGLSLLSFCNAAQKTGQTIVNAGSSALMFINAAKGLSLTGSTANWPNQLNADGYPTGSSVSGLSSGSIPVEQSYYGHYSVIWTGNGGIQFGLPAIIYNGGASVSGLGANTGSTNATLPIGFAATQPNSTPVEFAFGVLLASVANSGGLVQFTTTQASPLSGIFNVDNTVNLAITSIVGNGTTATVTTVANHGIPSGVSIRMVVSGVTPAGFNTGGSISCTSTGANTFTYLNATNATASVPGTYSPQISYFTFNNVTGMGSAPNADGSWTAWRVDNQNMILPQSAAVAGSVAVVGGGAGVQSEAILSVRLNPNIGLNTTFPASASITGGSYTWSNLYFCRTSELAAAQGGQIASPKYVSVFKAMNPRFARFMDMSGVQGDRSSSYTYRSKTTSWSWGLTGYNLDYYAGTITNGGSDAYSCANPTASPATGAFIDGEVICGQLSGANTTNNPTLTVTGRSGVSAVPIFGTSAGGGQGNAGLVNLFLTGSAPAQGQTVTFNFSGGGLGSPYSPVYTVTSAAAASLSALGGAIKAFLAADATLNAANVVIPASGGEPTGQFNIEYNQNIGGLGASKLTVSASDSTSSATYTWGKVGIGRYATSIYVAFTYSSLLGGFIVSNPSNFSTQSGGGIHGGPPLELYADLANRAGVGVWLNIGLFWNATRISNSVTALANLGVKELYLEVSNETWNSFEAEWCMATGLGACLGLTDVSNGNTCANGFTGLRTALVSQLAAAAWTGAGKSRSTLFVGLQYQFVDMASTSTFSTQKNRFEGQNLNTSTNTTLANFGGMGATALSFNPSTVGTRPVDFADCGGGAPYWCGAQFNMNNGATTIKTSTVTLSNYNGALLAAYNYAYGNSTQQAAALDFLYSVSGITGDLYDGQLNAVTNTTNQLKNFAVGSGTIADGYFGVGTYFASFDTGRLSLPAGQVGQAKLGVVCYEGFHDSGPTGATEITGLVGSLNTLGYTNGYSSALPGAAAGPSGTGDTSTTSATNWFNLLFAFKNDARFAALTAQYFTSLQTAANVISSRLAMAATYGFEGASVWSIYPGSIYSTGFQSVNEIQTFNN